MPIKFQSYEQRQYSLTVTTYLDCSFCFDKPASQHGLHVSVTEVLVGLQNLTLHHLLQQEATQTPVEESPHVLPVQNILSGASKGKVI